MNKAKLREGFEKVYSETITDSLSETTYIVVPDNLLTDMMNFFDVSTLEEFYEFMKNERDLSDRDINRM